MNKTMAEARTRRDVSAAPDQRRGLHDHGSVAEAWVALQNSSIRHVIADHPDQTDMATWMWRNDASPEAAAIAFGVRLPSERD